MSKLLVLFAFVAVASAATEWSEPKYVEDAAEPALIEEGGVPVSVGGRKGMVTYISPARKIQTSGIVFTPAPKTIVQAVTTPRPPPVVVAQPLYVQPVYQPHVHHHHHHHGLMHSAHGHHHHHHGMVHGHAHGHHHHRHLHGGVHHHHHHHHHSHHEDLVNAPFHHPPGFHFGHRHSRRHRNHAHAHGDLAVHLAATGRIGGGGAIHSYAPEAIPVSELNRLAHPHPAHYGHKSDSVSYGPIVVPHGPRGKIAVESAEFAGYNPGVKYQYNTVPTAHYSDGTAYPATINQRFS